jgi:hypothetical protein
LTFVTNVGAQTAKQEKDKFSIIPWGDVLLTVAAQPDCPLRLENPKLIWNVSQRRLEYSYDVRNSGKKAIYHFVTEAWKIDGTGGTLHDDRNDKKRILRSGTTFFDEEYVNAEFVPFSEQMRNSFKIGKETKMMIVLMVREVHFTDGTSFDGNKDVDRIKALFDKLGDECEILS